jgi:hypothetical protein
MVACALVQIACFWTVFGWTVPGRGEALDVPLFAAIVWKRVLIASTLGIGASERFRSLVAVASGGASVGVAVGLALLAALVATVVWLATGLPRGRRLWLPAAFALFTTLSIAGAIGNAPLLYAHSRGNQRYFLAPSALFLLLVLAGVHRQAPWRSLVGGVLLATTLWSSVPGWRTAVWWNPSWPQWRQEVAAWERDPQLPLRIWPRGWLMRLALRPGETLVAPGHSSAPAGAP